MNQAAKILPEILNDPTAEGGAKVLDRLGVDKSFMENMYRKYSPYASKAGLSSGAVRNAVTAVEKAMGNKSPAQQVGKKAPDFDITRYPDV